MKMSGSESDSEEDQSVETVGLPGRRKSFTLTYKQEVLKYCAEFSLHKAAAHFHLDRKTIRMWKKQSEEIKEITEIGLFF